MSFSGVSRQLPIEEQAYNKLLGLIEKNSGKAVSSVDKPKIKERYSKLARDIKEIKTVEDKSVKYFISNFLTSNPHAVLFEIFNKIINCYDLSINLILICKYSFTYYKFDNTVLICLKEIKKSQGVIPKKKKVFLCIDTTNVKLRFVRLINKVVSSKKSKELINNDKRIGREETNALLSHDAFINKVEDQTKIAYVYRYFKNGDVGDMVYNPCYGQSFPTKIRLEIIELMIKEVIRVHSQGYIHGDVKYDNFIWKLKKGKIKVALIDNENARKEDESVRKPIGTFGFYSPEKIRLSLNPQSNEKITRKSDIYGLGMCIFGLLLNEVDAITLKWVDSIIDAQNSRDFQLSLHNAGDRSSMDEYLKKTSKDINYFVLKLLDPIAAARPTAEETLELYNQHVYRSQQS